MGPCHWVSVATDVHLGEGADVPDADHLHGEVSEEVDDVQGLVPQQEDEDEGRHDGTQQLLQDEHLGTNEGHVAAFFCLHKCT